MKKNKYDFIFIIIAAVILSLINYLGRPELLSKYSFIVIFVGYHVGKYVGRYTK
jgi:hypothetical protein